MEGYIGQVIMFAGRYAPLNWMFCDGQTLDVSQNPALFSILGNTYGGDSIHNFKLPDTRKTDDDGMRHIICTMGLYPSRW